MIFDLAPDHPLSLVQIIGYVGMALGVFTFLQKDDRRLKLSMMVMACFMVVHFVLLGRFVAAFSAAMAGSRAGLSLIPFVLHHRHVFAGSFAVITCLIGFSAYEQWFDVLPFCAALLGTFRSFISAVYGCGFLCCSAGAFG